MKKFRHCKTWQRNAVAVAVASCFVIASPVYANPIGADVVNGVVSMAQQGNTLNITNSPGAIINWQGFSIGANEATRFIQQSAASGVLNRVTGVDPSSILGALQSNGRVFLINPNGVLFGAGAQVDVAGLIVSTLNLSNADFLNGRYNFTAHAGAGGIENQGNLTALPGGQIYLVAPGINNSGLITSPQGDILLAAGTSVELVNASSPDMRVVISAPDNQAVNLGSIVANSGRIGIYAGLINHHGIVSADTAIVGASGKITFKASRDINLEPGSVISASGASGGVHDGGEVRIIADGKLAMRQGSEVHVDGGVDGGNGGFLELSGLTGLSLRGIYSGRAHKAGFRNGSLLLDPMNINITSAGTHSMTGSNIAASSGTASASFTIAPASLSGGWANVSLAATNNITVSSPIGNADINNGTAGGSLTLTAGNDITIGAPIGASSARFNHDLTMTAGNNVYINSSIYLGNNTLTLTADADTSGFGDVLVTPTFSNSVIVNTLGNIFINAASLTILGGSASASGGSADAKLQAGGILDITVANGVTVQGGSASASASASFSSAQATANAELSAANLKIDTAGVIQVQGGNAYAQVSNSGASRATAEAKAEILVTNSLEITNGVSGLVSSVQVYAGNANAYANGSGSVAPASPDAKADANATMNAGSLILRANGLTIRGGGAHAQAGSSFNVINRSAEAQAKALVSVGTVTELTLGSGGLFISAGTVIGSPGTAIASGSSGVNTALSDRSALLDVTGSGDVLLTSAGGITIQGGSAQASASGSGTNTATEHADAGIKVGGLLHIADASSLTVQGGSASTSTSGTGVNSAIATAAASILAGNTAMPGGITATISGDVLLAGGNAAGTEAKMFSYGPITLAIGGTTGLSLTGTSGAGTGIFPNYNQPLSPITLTFTGGGSVQPFGVTAVADAWIQSLYVVPPIIIPPPLPAPAPLSDPLQPLQPALNTVLNGILETVALPTLNATLLAAVEQSDAQENPLEKKPTYTCQ